MSIAISTHAGADESSFFPARKFVTGFGPCDVEVADFNGDGIGDVVTGNCYDGSVTVLLGNESGVLSEPIVTNNVFFGVLPRSEFVVGEFTGDGFQDLVVSRGGLNRIQLLQGQGDGTFDVVQEVTTQAQPALSLTADFDNNGLPDVLFENGFARQLAVSLNVDGILADPMPIATISNADQAAADDFNGDGFTDLAVLSFSPSKIEVLFGNGDGTFEPVHQLLQTENLRHLFSNDFDADGIVDLLSFHESSEFFKGNGDGTFQPGVIVKSLSSAFYNFNNDAIVSDFNNDGFPDIAAANDVEHDSYLFLNNGDATFQPRQQYAAGLVPVAIQSGDVNGDGFLDLLTANIDASNLTTLLGNGDGTLQANLSTTFVQIAGDDLQRVDLNGDNISDLVSRIDDDDVIAVRLGLGDTEFSAPTFFAVGDRPESIAIEDFNNDGFMDVASANWNSDDVSVLLGVGDGTFQEQARFPVPDRPHSIFAGNFNADQIVDLATISNSGSVSVLPGEGNGAFGDSVETKSIGNIRGQAADFNGDGSTDIAVIDGQDICILLARGDGTFTAGTKVPHPLNVLVFTAADVNGDQNLDLVASMYLQFDLELVVSFGNGDGSFTDQQSIVEQQLNGGVQTFARSIVVSDFNGDNVSDIAALIEYAGSAHYGWTGAVAILPGRGDGVSANFQLFDLNYRSHNMAVGDFNQDGADDLLVPVYPEQAQLFLNQRQLLLGDVNRDCAVNLLDVEPFIQLIIDGEYQAEADANQDGQVTLLDVEPFIELLHN